MSSSPASLMDGNNIDGYDDGNGNGDGNRTRDFFSHLICFPPPAATRTSMTRHIPFWARAASMLPGRAWRRSTSTPMAKSGQEWWAMRASFALARKVEASAAAWVPLPFASVAAVVPSAYAWFAVAVEEAARPLVPCHHPPVVALALPCLL